MDFSSIEPINIIIYCRVSTKKQDEDKNNGLQSQYDICMDYIKSNYLNYKIIDHVSEIGSSYGNVHKLKKLHFLINSNKNITLFILETSRFGRNLMQINNYLDLCDKNNIKIISVLDSQKYGFTKVQNVNFVSESLKAVQESNIKSNKKISNNIIKRQKGEFIGGKIPLGHYVKNKKLCKFDNYETVIINLMEMLNLHAMNEVINYANNNNLFNKSNWNSNSIRIIIKRIDPSYFNTHIPIKKQNKLIKYDPFIDKTTLNEDQLYFNPFLNFNNMNMEIEEIINNDMDVDENIKNDKKIKKTNPFEYKLNKTLPYC